jgi:hypothetical protein
MATATPTAPARRRTKRGPLPNWAYWTLGVLGTILFLVVITLMFGRIGGEEFSPHDFKRRTFHYYEIPVARIQVWPVKRFDATGDLETNLVRDKLILVKPPAEPRWDLVHGYRGGAPVAKGDAAILCGYLDARDKGFSQEWLAWSNDKPALAKILWPLVAELAQQELYWFLPDMFELARIATDEKEFEAKLHALMAQKYHDFALVQQKLGYHEAEVELLTSAVKYGPEEKEWKKELEDAKKKVEAEKK